MSLYLKYRPKNFDEVIGNKAVVYTIKSLLKTGKFPHSSLLTGPTGCGKTTLARIIADELGAGGDFVEIDSADFRGIDTIREIRKRAQYAPMNGKCRVFLLDECHKLSNDAQNAMLKILEDTPKHVYFILATTDPQKLISTIKGRTTIFEVKVFNDNEMMHLLRRVVRQEGENLQKLVYEQIIQDSFGHPRNALQILEKVLASPEDQRLQIAKQTAEAQSQSIELCRALIDGSPWKKVSNILKGLKDEDPESIRRHVLGYSQSVLLNKTSDRAAIVIDEFSDYFYSGGFARLILACYTVVKS